MKTISLQLSGLIRGFRFKETRDNIYNLLIKPLKDQGYQIDIFIHTYDKEFDDIINKLNFSEFPIRNIQIDRDIDIQNYLKEEIDIYKNYDWYPHWTEDYKYGWFKYYNSINKCNELRKKYQKKKYDWIIISSPQLKPVVKIDEIINLHKNYIYFPDYAHFGGYYDSFMLGNEYHINHISTLYEQMIVNKKYKLINPEVILKKFVDEKYQVGWLKIRFNRIRYNGGVIDH